MNKQLILDRLIATRKKLRNLPDSKFDYSGYITKYHNGCGTVCCVAGHYPLWFPEAGLVYRSVYDDPEYWEFGKQKVYLDTISGSTRGISNLLANYHGLKEDLIAYLFYGDSCEELDDYVESMFLSKKDVIKRFTNVINYVKKKNFI